MKASNDPLNINEKLADDYSVSELGTVIPFIYGRCGVNNNSWFAIDTIAYITQSSPRKWKISVFKCWDEEKYESFIVAFYSSNPTNPSDKYYVDQFGNCYESERHLLLSFFSIHFDFRVKNYIPYNQTKVKTLSTKDISGFNLFKFIHAGFRRLFPGSGIEILNKFTSAFEKDDETTDSQQRHQDEAVKQLKEIKIIFPFFRLLLTVGITHIDFYASATSFEVIVKQYPVEIDYKVSRIESFVEFDKLINTELNVESIAYDEQCKQIISNLKNRNKITWENGRGDLDRFEKYINSRYGWCKILAYGCLNIAAKILLLQTLMPIKLSRLKFLTFWIQYKCTLDYNELDCNVFDETAGNDEKIRNLINQFNRLLHIAKISETSAFHQFSNNYSKAYHINAHFEKLKCFHSNFHNNLTAIERQQLNSVTITRQTDITTIKDLHLRTCSKYYLQTITDYVFDGDVQNIDVKDSFETHYYIENIADESIQGVKKRYAAQGIIGNLFVASVYLQD